MKTTTKVLSDLQSLDSPMRVQYSTVASVGKSVSCVLWCPLMIGLQPHLTTINCTALQYTILYCTALHYTRFTVLIRTTHYNVLYYSTLY